MVVGIGGLRETGGGGGRGGGVGGKSGATGEGEKRESKKDLSARLCRAGDEKRKTKRQVEKEEDYGLIEGMLGKGAVFVATG